MLITSLITLGWCTSNVPLRIAVNSTFFIKALKYLRNAIWQTRLEKLENNWILDHDRVSCYISLAVQQFLLNNRIPTIIQPSYSSGFTSYSFSLYLRPKNGLKGTCFHVQKHSTECDGSFHSHAMCLKQWQGWSKLCACESVCVYVCACACACTPKNQSSAFQSTYLVSHLNDRSII